MKTANKSTTRMESSDSNGQGFDSTGRKKLSDESACSPWDVESQGHEKAGDEGTSGMSTGADEEGTFGSDSKDLKRHMLRRALWALRFAVFADAVNQQVLGPNYALMVTRDGTEESFSSTEPLSFGAAYYFMPMVADIGIVLGSIIFGRLSDKIGRRPCTLACLYLGAVASIAKYLARHNYWAFNAAGFVDGLSSGILAIAMAYAGDAYTSQEEIDGEIGKFIALNLIGRTGGGIVAVTMQTVGLFSPLLFTGPFTFISGIVCHLWMSDAKQDCSVSSGVSSTDDTSISEPSSGLEDIEENKVSSCDSMGPSIKAPTAVDKKALCIVLLGELADNFGSIGLVPLCVSPLLYQTFYAAFEEEGLDPIMSATAYKLIYIFLAIVVIPGALASPVLFRKIGPAISAVGANVLTGTVTLALLFIANVDPPSFATYVVFVVVLYCFFPLTVISQLSTGPMLSRICPPDQRGEIQGYNMAVMNFAGAIGPFLYGGLYDLTSIDVTLYIAAGISVVAAFINGFLIRDVRFGPKLSK